MPKHPEHFKFLRDIKGRRRNVFFGRPRQDLMLLHPAAISGTITMGIAAFVMMVAVKGASLTPPKDTNLQK